MKKWLGVLLAASLLGGTAMAMNTQIDTFRIIMPNNPIAEQRINEVLTQARTDALAQSADILATEEEDRAAGDYRQGYLCEVHMELIYRSANYTSILTNFEYNRAGAHGYAGHTGYVFDNHTGAHLALTDLPGYEYGPYVEETIRNDLDSRAVAYDPELLAKALNGGNIQNFYIDYQGYPVVVFNPYIVGPYALGQVTSKLPLPVE